MPNFDRTGPKGNGPRSGKKEGLCSTKNRGKDRAELLKSKGERGPGKGCKNGWKRKGAEGESGMFFLD
jgi:hypothetical protein